MMTQILILHGRMVKMMTLQINSDHSIGTQVTSITQVYQIEVDLNVDSSSFDFNLFQTDIVHSSSWKKLQLLNI
jgi:hypothetical protein